jgi:hypothetical protein
MVGDELLLLDTPVGKPTDVVMVRLFMVGDDE